VVWNWARVPNISVTLLWEVLSWWIVCCLGREPATHKGIAYCYRKRAVVDWWVFVGTETHTGKEFPIIIFTGLGKLNHGLFEVTERTLHQTSILFEVHQEIVPQRLSRQNLGISKYDQTVLGPCKSHVEAARVIQKTNSLVFVGPNTGKDDEIFLTSLKRVNRSNFDLFVKLRAQW
jgi:hypothetical protein